MAIVHFQNYQLFKNQMDSAMTETANHFVKIGYLLKEARDTNVLQGSGYSGMGEFAETEYGLRPDQTSRFIAICERYGNGEDQLQDQYTEYGYAKLSEMLTLPMAVTDSISPEVSRQEIRDIKKDVEEEKKITDIEVVIEKSLDENTDRPLEERIFFEYFKKNKASYEKAVNLYHISAQTPKSQFMQLFADSGYCILSARIPGEGRMILSVKSEEKDPVIVKVREDENKEISWHDFITAYTLQICDGISWKDKYPDEEEPEAEEKEAAELEELNAKEIEPAADEKEEIAPAQTDIDNVKPLSGNVIIKNETEENEEPLHGETEVTENIANEIIYASPEQRIYSETREGVIELSNLSAFSNANVNNADIEAIKAYWRKIVILEQEIKELIKLMEGEEI